MSCHPQQPLTPHAPQEEDRVGVQSLEISHGKAPKSWRPLACTGISAQLGNKCRGDPAMLLLFCLETCQDGTILAVKSRDRLSHGGAGTYSLGEVRGFTNLPAHSAPGCRSLLHGRAALLTAARPGQQLHRRQNEPQCNQQNDGKRDKPFKEHRRPPR